MNITLYKFAKDNNSTARPAGAGTTYTCALKDETDVLNPVISISMPTAVTSPVTLYNYAYIPAFERYYFITGWRWTLKFWEITLAVDVLATFKTEIGASSQYVLRSASSYDSYVVDEAYPSKSQVQISTTALNKMFETYIYNGTFVVGIISGDNTDSMGSVTYYMMSSAQFGAFKNKIFGSDWITDMAIEDITEGLLKTMFNPYQYIASCYYFPIPTSAYAGTNVTSIKFGWWDISANALRLPLNHLQATSSQSFNVPLHPQSASRGKYLNKKPYTEYQLYCPPFGIIPIDPTFFNDTYTHLHFSISLDYVTGLAILEIMNGTANASNTLIYEATANVGVPIQTAGAVINLEQSKNAAIVGIVGGAAQAAVNSSNIFEAIGNAGNAIISGVGNILQYAVPQVQTGGVNGSTNIYSVFPGFTSKFYLLVDEDINKIGRPLCKIKTINELTGFVMCRNSHVNISCTDSERSAIKSYMDGGFFYE